MLQRQFEPFFLLEDLGRRGHGRSVKRAQLLDAILFVFRLLIFIFEAHRAPLQFENPLHLFKRQFVTLAQFAQKALHGVVHDASEAERGPRPFFQRPQIPEQILLRARPVAVYRRRAQRERLRRRMKRFCPIGNARENFRGVLLGGEKFQAA